MTTFAALLLVVATSVALTGCGTHFANAKLTTYDEKAGYRFDNLSRDDNSDELFVILAFSGGGTRAAAFSFGVLEALRDTVYESSGHKRSFLDDVDVISSVSGGSFTAAYYGLFRNRIFTDFVPDFLNRNVQSGLIRRALWPGNWFRLAFSDFDRIDLAAEYYDETIFKGKTFDDLLRLRRRPFVILNATDMTLGRRFEFTQDQFDLLCSDVLKTKVATAVAASSAFPGLLSPLTLKNFAAERCGYKTPQWITDALGREDNPPRRYTLARDLSSYQDSGQRRDYIHLLDGGLADNIGLRGPYVALSTTDSGWSVVGKINRREIRRVVVITANAKTKSHKDWDTRQPAPGVLDVLSFVTSGPMDNYSFDTVQLIRDFFAQQKSDANSWRSCQQLLEQSQCTSRAMPAILDPVELHAAELSFDNLEDDGLRRCMEGLPTTFYLPGESVTLLRQVGQKLLMTSREFQQAMRALDPGWQPSSIVIDPALQAKVCP
jgi:predicted acylesterase/phospholipase RssA